MQASKNLLTSEEVQKGLSNVIKDGLATQAMLTITGGVFLVTFALKMGASNLVIGFLAAIPPLAQLIQIPSVYLVEKYRSRRLITTYASFMSKVFLLFVGCIPIFFPQNLWVPLLLGAVILRSAFVSLGGCSWNSWMRDLVPQDEMGTFFSRRMSLARALDIPLSLIAGMYIDYWRRTYTDYEIFGYSILFFVGFFVGLIGVYYISRTPEYPMGPPRNLPHFFTLVAKPFKDKNFKNLMTFMGSWNFAVNLAAPFFTVYMLKRLEMDLSLIIAFTVLSQIMNIAFLQTWGRFADRFSHKSVLGVSGPLFIVSILAWTFTTLPEKYVLTIPLLVIIHVVMGISTAGITLASTTIGLKLAPKGEATSYLAANSLVNSCAAGIAPVLGGLCADFFAERELSLTLNWISPGRELTIQTLNLQQWDFFFFLAFVIGLYSIHRLSSVKEEGEVKEKVLITELMWEVKRSMNNLSTIGGLRRMIQFPFSVVTALKNKNIKWKYKLDQ
jgi:MFS family permease